MKIASVGEILWDIFPQARYVGGAPFNFAYHAHNLGHEVCFVSGVGQDRLGMRALQQMEAANLSTRFVRRTPDYPTGTVTVSFSNSGAPQYQIHRPAAYDFPALASADFQALLTPPPQWIYYGTLQQMSAPAHELTMRLLDATQARRFYDVNLRADSYTADLVRKLAEYANVLKLSEEELPGVQEILGIAASSREQFCRNSARAIELEAVCITRGAEGCSLLLQDEFIEAPGFRVQIADTIGAGDAFSAALVHGLSQGWLAPQAADFANRVGAIVASHPGGTPQWSIQEAMALKAAS
jgi:fructokinase